MPNPRYIKDGKPTEELEFKLKMAHYIYVSELEPFCKGYSFEHELENLRNVKGVYLIGSHATDSKWDNENSDIDFKLLIPNMLPEAFDQYKRKVLDAMLHIGEKKKWIDLFAVNESYKVISPYFDLTSLWINFKNGQ
ncbi:MAG: hypothetical protein AABX61_03550 [Nanoarchaeota archaeon]